MGLFEHKVAGSVVALRLQSFGGFIAVRIQHDWDVSDFTSKGKRLGGVLSSFFIAEYVIILE